MIRGAAIIRRAHTREERFTSRPSAFSFSSNSRHSHRTAQGAAAAGASAVEGEKAALFFFSGGASRGDLVRLRGVRPAASLRFGTFHEDGQYHGEERAEGTATVDGGG